MAKRKTALVTGSTSGIGLAIARRLGSEGYNIVLNSFEPEASVSDAIGAVKSTARGGVAYIQADLALEQGTDLVIDTIARFGRIDVLVNNAGIQKVARIEDFLQEDWERVRAIILDGAFQTIRAAVPDMLSRKWGRIINIASAHALVASPFKSAYVAAKHGLLGLTKTVALEVAENAITVNAICPGYVLTPLVEKQLKDQSQVHAMSKEQVKREIMLAPQPTRQFVEVEEIAAMAAYLCGDMARSITGTSIAIDGGWTAH
ncbi:MAG TPA: 3-hydroxybutyrate dehydrogenase [Devosia sp.]|nr:3-hydroxybutyrate dehydrogenase [Devosia sp.]